MNKILVVGSGGLAREFSDYFASQIEIVGYSTNNPSEVQEYNLTGQIFDDHVTPSLCGVNAVVIAVGDPRIKSKLVQIYADKGFIFPSFVHSSSVVSSRAKIGDGVIVSPNCTISLNVLLDNYSFINYSSGIGHESIIGKFSQVNPGVQVGGSTVIGDYCLIGSGSTIIDGIQIASGARIGSGSVVLGSVSAGSMMLGNPARRMPAFE